MGCGKSSVGRKLSELLCCPFMDLDDVIVEREGRSIPEIFASDGEAAFRRMELEALRSIIALSEDSVHQTDAIILALGGGTVITPECAEIVKEQTCCVYLRASIETLMEHLSGEADERPLLTGGDIRERIGNLMKQRADIYEALAHHVVCIDGKGIDETADEIISLTR